MKYFVTIFCDEARIAEERKFTVVKRIKGAEEDNSVEFLVVNGERLNHSDFWKEIEDGKTLGCKVSDANFFVKNANYVGRDEQAWICVADSSGFKDAMIKDPTYATTYGMGQQIANAVKLGKRRINLFVDGGTACDCGTGAACALGMKFFDENGEEFIPNGATLERVQKIKETDSFQKMKDVVFVGVSAKKCTLTGESGCANNIAKGMGAKNEKTREEIERNFCAFGRFLGENEETIDEMTGCGGGVGLFVTKCLSGNMIDAEEYISISEFEGVREKIKACDAVIFVGIDEGTEKNETIKAMRKKIESIARECGKPTTVEII